jgi:hypothetical protein
VGLLTKDEIKVTLSSCGTDVSKLSARQLQLLRLPQNLWLYIKAGLIRHSKPEFLTQKELFDEYWEFQRRALQTTHPTEVVQWKPLFDKLAREMSDRQELSVPHSCLDEFSTNFLNALVSAGVLSVDRSRYGFGHESFFDYCYARSVASRDEEFAAELEPDEQHLFRRAQLRRVLVYLREADFRRYLQNVKTLLTSSRIRSHLKVLTLKLLSSLPEPKPEGSSIIPSVY